jgi:2-iminobutanoate/2-iminopropanoate deaminase
VAQADTIFRLRGENSYSQAVRAGDLLFISGTVSWDDDFKVIAAGDAAAQVDVIYRDIARTLAHFGLDAGAVVRETSFITQIADAPAVRAARRHFYSKAACPAVTTIVARRLTNLNLVLEIECVAAFPTPNSKPNQG